MGALEELRSNQRLRIGVVAILVILLAYGLLEWRDRQAVAVADYTRLLNQVARLGANMQPAQWQQRASEARGALDQARSQLWRNQSIGLAQAQVQDWLNGLLRQAGAKALSVRVSEPEVNQEGQALVSRLPADLQSLQLLRARIEFSSDPTVLLALLAAFNDSPQRVILEGLTIKQLKTEMVLNFWFEITPAGKGPGA